MYLTDDENNLTKWPFPDVSIGAEGYMKIFASGKNRSGSPDNLHANFKLAKTGPILLVDKDGKTVIDKNMVSNAKYY